MPHMRPSCRYPRLGAVVSAGRTAVIVFSVNSCWHDSTALDEANRIAEAAYGGRHDASGHYPSTIACANSEKLIDVSGKQFPTTKETSTGLRLSKTLNRDPGSACKRGSDALLVMVGLCRPDDTGLE